MEDIFIKRYPKIDLHGCDRDTARMLVNDFIADNVMLKNEIVVIIHGKGTGIVKRAVHETLKNNKYVMDFKTDNFNDGMTLVKLDINKKYS